MINSLSREVNLSGKHCVRKAKSCTTPKITNLEVWATCLSRLLESDPQESVCETSQKRPGKSKNLHSAIYTIL